MTSRNPDVRRVVRQVAYAELQRLESLERIYRQVHPRMAGRVERALHLGRGHLTTWLADQSADPPIPGEALIGVSEALGVILAIVPAENEGGTP